jgi:hypothetical protein
MLTDRRVGHLGCILEGRYQIPDKRKGWCQNARNLVQILNRHIRNLGRYVVGRLEIVCGCSDDPRKGEINEAVNGQIGIGKKF